MSTSATACPRCRYEVGVLGLGACPECGLELEWRPVGRRLLRLSRGWFLAFATAVLFLNLAGMQDSLAIVWSNERAMASESAARRADRAGRDLEFAVQGWWHGTPTDLRLTPPPRLRPPAAATGLTEGPALRRKMLSAAALPGLASVLSLAALVVLAMSARRPLSVRAARNVRAILVSSLVVTALGLGSRFVFGSELILFDLLT